MSKLTTFFFISKWRLIGLKTHLTLTNQEMKQNNQQIFLNRKAWTK